MRFFTIYPPLSSVLAGCAAILAVAAGALAYAYGAELGAAFDRLGNIPGWLSALAQERRWLAYGGYMLYLALVLVLSLPLMMPSILLAAAIFGYWEAAALVMAGRMLAAGISFACIRRFTRLARAISAKPWCDRLCRRMHARGGAYVLVLRMLPLLPDSVVNYSLGLTPLRWRTYLGASFLGMLPLTLLSIALGSELTRLLEARFWNALLPQPEIMAQIAVAGLALLAALYASFRLLPRPGVHPFENQLPIGAAAYRRRLATG